MANKKTVSGRKSTRAATGSGAGSKRSSGRSKSANGSTHAREQAAVRLGEVAHDVANLAASLGRGEGGASLQPGTGDDSNGVSAGTQRRLELLARLLDKQTHELTGPPAVESPAPIPRNAIAFSWLPDIDVDNNSVTIGVPGVGEASIGSDGASVSVDGVGGASVGSGGVSVNAGGTNVSIGSDGAEVSVPGAGTVRVGPDGSVSVDPAKGGDCGSGISLPGLPIPSLCTTELKIPIPVPKFVMEPFEIPVNVPRLDPSPLPIPIPSPTLEPNPVPIPYPAFDFNPGSPHLGDFSSFDAVMDISAAQFLEHMMADMKDVLKDMTKDLADEDDATGNPEPQKVAKVVQLAEVISGMLRSARDLYSDLRDLVVQSPVVVSAALASAWQQFQALAASLLQNLDKLLETAIRFASPKRAVVAAVRTIYLIIGWILARVVRGTLKLSGAMTSRFLQLGGRLHSLA